MKQTLSKERTVLRWLLLALIPINRHPFLMYLQSDYTVYLYSCFIIAHIRIAAFFSRFTC